MTAATSCDWYITVSTGRTICMSPARVGIQCSLYPSRSLPVTTAATPGILSASLASIDLIVACAYGLRTMSSQSWPGRLTSSMYSPSPRMKRGSSLRLTEWPMPPISALVRGSAAVVMVVAPRSTGGDRRRAGRLLDRLDDIDVARTATQVAADALADLGLGGVRVLAEQPGRLHDHARGAEAALEPVLVPERLLQRVERGAVGHPLDGLDLVPVGLDREDGAGLRALAVEVDGARAAVAGVAPDVGAGQPEVVAQEVDEQEPRFDVGLVGLAVDGDRDVLRGHRGRWPPTRTRSRGRRRCG